MMKAMLTSLSSLYKKVYVYFLSKPFTLDERKAILALAYKL